MLLFGRQLGEAMQDNGYSRGRLWVVTSKLSLFQAKQGLRCSSLVSPPSGSFRPTRSACPITKFEYEVHTVLLSASNEVWIHVLFVKLLSLPQWHGSAGAKRTLRLDFSQNETPYFCRVWI